MFKKLQERKQQQYEDIKTRGLLPILCGGTGMYLESILKGYRLLPVPENKEFA